MTAKKQSKADGDYWIDLAQYHSADVEALLQRHRQMEKLIGGQHHSPSEGYHCEVLLADYLKRILPSRYAVDTGFVRGNPTERGVGKVDKIVASPQVDILIHDSHLYSPIYRMGNLVVVVPDAVVAVIEVKKRLTSGQLADALDNIARTMDLLMQNRAVVLNGVFSAVIGFDANMPLTSNTYCNRLTKVMTSYGYPVCLPSQIADLSRGVFDLKWDGRRRQTDVMCWNAKYLPPRGAANLNLSLQLVARRLAKTIGVVENAAYADRFAIPPDIKPLTRFTVADGYRVS
jgi:hypothetical protein